MFRSIEGVYKANRGLHSVCLFVAQVCHYLTLLVKKLKEIGTNPSSPKALGDLLMRWVRTINYRYFIQLIHSADR
jgi:hypothetical protein